jgi:hypothetical protein
LTLNVEFIASTSPWKSTPLSRKITRAVTTTTPSGRAMRRGRKRPNSRTEPRPSHRMPRPIATKSANTSTARTTMPMAV